MPANGVRGAVLRDGHYEIAPLLEKIFLSRDFYSPASVGTQIKSPVQLVVGTVRMLGLDMPAQRILAAALTQIVYRSRPASHHLRDRASAHLIS